MSIYTPERRDYFKTRVHEMMVMDPNLSATRAVVILKEQGIDVGYDLVLDFMKEIDVERIEKADKLMLNHFIMQFMERVKLTDKVLWNILTDKEATQKDKLGAAREIRNNFSVLFQTMLDAGIFKRHLGELNIPNMGEILDLAKAIENGKDAKQIIFDSSGDSDKKEL